MATIRYEQAVKLFPGTEVPAVNSLDLSIEDGEFLVMVGPSGCGKSTSLRLLAGLEQLDSGKILIDDVDVTFAAPKDRDIAMVFQNYALYPHMSVGENMAFSLKLAGVSKSDITIRVAQAAALLDLEPFLDRKPKALSGGQRQRVAMGRAIVREPKVFLMDEPLSNLDAKLRVQTRTQIAQLQRRLDVTTVYVTHDQVEAMTMGDRVAVMKDGVLQQCDSPRNLYRRPANKFVAGFMGSPAMNLIEAPLTDQGVKFNNQVALLSRESLSSVHDRTVTLGVRPEHLILGDVGEPMEIDLVEELGAEAYVFGRATINGSEQSLSARIDWRNPPQKGSVVKVQIDTDHVHAFRNDAEGQRIECVL